MMKRDGVNMVGFRISNLSKVILLIALIFSSSQAFSSIREPTTPIALRVDVQTIPGGKISRSQGKQVLVPLHMARDTKSDILEAKRNTNMAQSTDGEVSGTSSEKKSQRSLVAGIFLSTLAALSGAARTGILKGPVDLVTGEFSSYTDSMILQDAGSAILTAALGYVLVKLIALGYNMELYGSKISRKLSHTLSAPLFILFFPIFSQADGARFFAASVALVNAIRLFLAGTGGDSSLASTISRSGDKKEVLQGPFIYVCLFQLFIVLCWRSSMVGVIAMSTMAAGDGMADLVGRQFGKNNKWFFSDSKSIAGSVAFVVASSITSFGLVNWLSGMGSLEYSLAPIDLALRIVGISIACAVVELFPFVDDNYSVPLTAAGLTALFLY